MLEAEFGIPAILDDSTRMMAIAEKCFGIGQQIKDFVYISVGMGIGAGIFIDDKLYRGSGGGAGEFGHMTVDEDGPLCSCGNSGCLEVLASCTAIIQSVRTAIQKGVSSKINEWVKGDLDRISIEIIARAAKENDALGFRVLYDAVFHIGVALADVVNLLNPSTVVFGGPLFREAGGLLETLRTVIRQRALEKFANELQLKISTLGSEAGALGAARMVSEKVLLRLYEEKTQMAHAS
jgi:predicted NBD/HSP70 family sugar kinase